MSDSKCQTVFLAVHNTIWGWWYKTMANFHWIRSSPMDSQCKCHSGGTNIFRFYDKHKCIINLDLAKNTELVPNIHMSYTEKRWKNSNACQYLSTNNLNKLPITFMYYTFMGNLYWGLWTNAYHQDFFHMALGVHYQHQLIRYFADASYVDLSGLLATPVCSACLDKYFHLLWKQKRKEI